MAAEPNPQDLLTWTAAIVSSHVRNSETKLADLPPLIKAVHDTLRDLSAEGVPATAQEPAVPIEDSVTNTYIVCLEDGLKLKMLKRHLNTAYSMSPEEYRDKWNLPPDYPMVAPAYARQRSTLAKKIGLGKRRT